MASLHVSKSFIIFVFELIKSINNFDEKYGVVSAGLEQNGVKIEKIDKEACNSEMISASTKNVISFDSYTNDGLSNIEN